MKLIVFFIDLIFFIHCLEKIGKQKIIKHNNNLIEIGKIFNLLNNKYLSIENNIITLLSDSNTYFSLTKFGSNSNNYLIEYKNHNKYLGIDEQGNILLYDNKIDLSKIIWKVIKIKKNNFFVKNTYNNKYLEVNNYKLQCLNSINFLINKNIDKYKLKKRFIFEFHKLYEKVKLSNNHIKYINKEPIDILIKYIDLTDKNLNREGIMQIYKDFDNEELRFSLRSILENIPWIRKIFILMPNEKVKYLKSYKEIREKIIYIFDKDLLGFDTANIHSFTFNLYKLENFGISKNFIYLEDDFFIGKPLKKHDFFYYDQEKNKVLPFLLTNYFQILNKTIIINKYYEIYKIRNNIHPHSSNGWWFSIFSTDKYLIEKYNSQLINTNFTHNAISENLDDLKEIYKEIKDYSYFNETIYSKERHILSLNQPHFTNLYQLNIKHKKVNSINNKYVEMENIKNFNLKVPLFVINTCGNHIPLKRQNKIQKRVMNKRFSLKIKYEIINNDKMYDNLIKILFIEAVNFLIIFSLVKIFILFVKLTYKTETIFENYLKKEKGEKEIL